MRRALAQEVAYLASRTDIAEELTRFQSHLEQATHLLAESAEVGKKLDFLLQEMNREANTFCQRLRTCRKLVGRLPGKPSK